MTFPPISNHIVFDKNPLEEVICQIRFPAILRINAEMPAVFQEAIRHNYPKFEKKDQIEINISGQIVQQGSTTYTFGSKDENWIVTLTSNFIALTCLNYSSWTKFKEHLEEPLNAFLKEYKPAYYSRIGLRYKNVITRSKYNLESSIGWSTLFNEYVSGLLRYPEMGAIAETFRSQAAAKLNDQGDHVAINYGIGFYEKEDLKEEAFILDNDFFSNEETEVENVYSTLNRLNDQSGNLFRWAISERLHEYMEPRG